MLRLLRASVTLHAAIVLLLLGAVAAVPIAFATDSRPGATGSAAVDESRWVALPPPMERVGHSAVYDSKRDRMLVFGGNDETDVWSLPFAGGEGWTLLRCAGTPPAGRLWHGAIYDPVRDRMIVFGGDAHGVLRNDLWALDLTGTPSWSALTPSGPAPTPVASPSAVYDPIRDRMVVFGGLDGQNPVANCWALSLSGPVTWTALAPEGASNPALRRWAHAAAYDAAHDRMLIFGGVQQGLRLNDTWACEFTGPAGWHEVATVGDAPSARFAPGAIYESTHDRLVVFGGYDGQACSDARALSLDGTPTWTYLAGSPGNPPGRLWHSVIFDPVRDRLVTFAGRDSVGRNDTWALTLGAAPTWTAIEAVVPDARQLHSAILDTDHDRLVIFGGESAKSPFWRNDVWALSLTNPPAWQPITPAGTPPPPRRGHSAIFDPVRRRMIVFGGYDMPGLNTFDDVWALSMTGSPTWTQMHPTGDPPSARYGHSAVYDPVRDRMIVFGGFDGTNYDSDVWALDLSGPSPAWTPIAPQNPPGYGIAFHTAVYDPVRDQMIVFGGRYHPAVDTFSNSTLVLALSGTPAWSGLAPASPPAARDYSGAVYDPVGDQMVIFGGETFPGYNYISGDVAALPLSPGSAWTALVPSGGGPNSRRGHTTTFDPFRDRVIVFGGADGFQLHNATHALLLSSTVSVRPAGPATIRLGAPRPNPSAGASAVDFDLPVAAHVILDVFDLHGRRVVRLADGAFSAGPHTLRWNGRNTRGEVAGAGVYFIRLTAGTEAASRRLVELGDLR